MIVERFCEGSLEQLLVGMVESKVVDQAELQEMARKIAKLPQLAEPDEGKP